MHKVHWKKALHFHGFFTLSKVLHRNRNSFEKRGTVFNIDQNLLKCAISNMEVISFICLQLKLSDPFYKIGNIF